MKRYYYSSKKYSDYALERYTNSLDELFLVIGLYNSYMKKSYLEAGSFSEFYDRIFKLLDFNNLTVVCTFTNRGHKIIRDILNSKGNVKSIYFKQEIVSLGKKGRLFPIRLPKRASYIVEAIFQYLIDFDNDEDFILVCIEHLKMTCPICVHKLTYSIKIDDETHCPESVLGFQYEYLIKLKLSNPKVDKLYRDFSDIFYNSYLNKRCNELGEVVRI